MREVAITVGEATRAWWDARELRRVIAPLDPNADPPADAPGPAADSDRKAALNYAPVPPRELDQLEAQVVALREGPIDERGMIVRNLAEAGPQLWPEIRELLLVERERPKREYKQVLAVIGGDVPNRYGHFALHWKKAHGYDVRVSEDWFEDLLALSPARISKPLRPVYRDALLTVALLRAASHIARADPRIVGEVVNALLNTAYAHGGVFRDEVGRAIDSIGNPAIPHLLRASVTDDDWQEGSIEERRAAYATYCLDRMDRLHPSQAIAAVRDDRRLLADVLHAYAIVRDGEAAPLLLDWIDTNAAGVRRAARSAFEAYVTGPLPKIRRKSIRLLNGQTSTQRAQLSYREHARLAIRDRLGNDEPDLLEPECTLWQQGGIIDAECERQPERLFRAYIKRLDERRIARRDALVSRALASHDHAAGAAMLDTLLTDDSDPIEAELVAPFYVEVASEAEARGDPARAAQLLRKSAMLLADIDPTRTRDLTVAALLLEAQAEGVDASGKAMLLGTAHDLSPDDPAVGAAITALDIERGQSTDPLRKRLVWIMLGLFVGLGLLAWIAARIHRPQAQAASASPQ